MVRLDKCVEALYDDSVTNDNRNKNLQILNVMKGAISMSRSKTGECIFRTNKTEKKNLERVLRSEGRNSNYNIAQIDSKRKQVLIRWSKVLEQQTVCSSETLFEELMEINHHDNDDSLKVGNSESPDPGDGKLRHLVNLRLSAIEKETNAGTYVPVVPRRRRLSFKSDDSKSADDTEFVTVDKQIRGKYSDGKPDETTVKAEVTNTVVPTENVQGKTKLVHLPVIRQENVTTSKNPDTSPRPMPPERDLTDWGNWGLKDKSWIKGYLFREKTRHEDLIIRNALNKIESDMSGANMIQRQQMRHKLQQEKQQREAEARHHMREQKVHEASSDSDLMSSGAPKEVSVSDKLPVTTVTESEKDSTREDGTILIHDTQLLKQVNFDENLKVHVFNSEDRRKPIPRRARNAHARRSVKSTHKLSLPIIPENIKPSKQGTQLKSRN